MNDTLIGDRLAMGKETFDSRRSNTGYTGYWYWYTRLNDTSERPHRARVHSSR